MTASRISVVVPAYNVAAEIERCVVSLLGQTHGAMEILVINDCSTDDTAAVLDRLAADDARLIVVHLESNVGVHAARATGVNLASGDFIGFVDGDDWVAPDMYGRLLQAVSDTYADVAMCGAVAAMSETEFGAHKVRYRKEQVLEHELLRRFCRLEFGSGVLWNKLYRARLVRPHASLRLERAVDASEDYIVNVGCFAAARRIVMLPYVGYYYRLRPGSASRSPLPAQQFARVARAYVVCLETYAAHLGSRLQEIDSLYSRQLTMECYCVREAAQLRPYAAHLTETLRRLAAVRPEGLYALLHAFDPRVQAARTGRRGALRSLLGALRALFSPVSGKPVGETPRIPSVG